MKTNSFMKKIRIIAITILFVVFIFPFCIKANIGAYAASGSIPVYNEDNTSVFTPKQITFYSTSSAFGSYTDTTTGYQYTVFGVKDTYFTTTENGYLSVYYRCDKNVSVRVGTSMDYLSAYSSGTISTVTLSDGKEYKLATFYVKKQTSYRIFVFSDNRSDGYRDASRTVYVCASYKYSHVFGEWGLDTAASCTENGRYARVCSSCLKREYEEIPALGHNWGDDYTVDIEPTCTEDGSESIHCERCNKSNEETSRILPMLGHAWSNDYSPIIQPTCTEEGSEAIHCSRCNIEKEDTERVTPPTGHTWMDTYTTDIPATCSRNGSESIHCLNCGCIKEGSERSVKKLPHDLYREYDYDVYADCTQSGKEAYRCTVCDTLVYKSVPAYGHAWDNYWNVTVYPTAISKGVESTTCMNCGAKANRSIEKLTPYADFYEKTFYVAPKKSINLSDNIDLQDGDYVVSWKVNKKKLATINKAGKLKAKKKKGTVKVTAYLASGLKATCKVKIAKVKKKKTGGGTVYWTPSGKVYHESKDCPTLARSKKIKSGSIKKSKKKRCCKVCG